MFQTDRCSNRQFVTLFLCLPGLFAMGFCSTADAQEKKGESETSFAKIIEARTRASLQAVGEYARNNPTADDSELAYRWLFETASFHDLEDEILSLAEEYLDRDPEGQASRSHAHRVRSIGMAKVGKPTEALAGFHEHLKTADFRRPNSTLEFGILLVAQMQLQGEFDAVEEIYDTLLQRFFLNEFARRMCESRMSHMEFAQKPAPEIGTKDLDGKPIDVKDYLGKVVLVDFWGVNCGPCLAQFPGLKKLYADYHDKGFEIVGITLDEDRELVDQFQKEWQLPWTLSLSGSDRDETTARYHVSTVPTMYLVDQRGKVAFVDLRGDNLRNAVEKLLAPKK